MKEGRNDRLTDHRSAYRGGAPMSVSTGSAVTPATRECSSWAAVASLGLGIFAIIMSEFLPESLLPRMAAGLGVEPGEAGQAVSVTAFAAPVFVPMSLNP